MVQDNEDVNFIPNHRQELQPVTETFIFYAILSLASHVFLHSNIWFPSTWHQQEVE